MSEGFIFLIISSKVTEGTSRVLHSEPVAIKSTVTRLRKRPLLVSCCTAKPPLSLY